MTGILADEIDDYLEKEILLQEEQKECRQKCRVAGRGRWSIVYGQKDTLRGVNEKEKACSRMDLL